MPIYEYVCLDCGEHFESLRTMKDADAPINCRQCESIHISRMLSRFNATSGGRVIASSSSGCAGCSGSSCASCKS
jgi:putative FmdB family regulatory protein